MTLHVMPKALFTEWTQALCTRYRVIGPKRRQDCAGDPFPGDYYFGIIQSAGDLAMAYTNTILPPKKALLPQREELFNFKSDKQQLELQLDSQPTVLIGVHTCDLHAVLMLDQVFTRDQSDQHYIARRANTTFVSIECLSPCSEDAFCKDMGTSCVPEKYDLHLTDLGEAYAVDIGSQNGSTLLEGWQGLTPLDDPAYRRLSEVMSAKWARFPYRLEADMNELPGLMSTSYKSIVWDELGQRCLGCGSCTAVCPTCYCFDVIDEVELDLTTGRRFRVWDSCQFSEFATVAGGHNFRSGRAARLRHRFCHKFRYQVEASGIPGCVGCGRCAASCLVGVKPVDLLNTLLRKRTTQSGKQREVLV